MSKSEKPPIDNPIKTTKQDALGRAEVAHQFAKNIRRLDASEGIVVGVIGDWGSGKSSFVNLMREEFRHKPELTVVDFNPWMFSGAQQLVDVFFKEVASELRLKDKTKFGKIADGLVDYGDVLSPVAMIPFIGAYFDRSFKALKSARRWWKERSATPLRNKVADALKSLDQPIVVVIDDIDRLSTDEIRDIFKLVRLTASFPNVIYILAFDRKRVEAALDEQKVPGRQYLEKIIQLSFDLPVIPKELMRAEIFKKLTPILQDVKNVRFDSESWPNIFFEIIEPLIGNLRDVTRLALSARTTVESLGAEVETADLLALEAIRVFRPELFERIHQIRQSLTKVSEPYGSRYDDDEPQKTDIERLLELAGNEREIVKKLIRHVFPAARRHTDNTHYGYDYVAGWRRGHRVAHIDYLGMYLERVAPSGAVAFRRSERAYEVLGDEQALVKYLDGLKPDELEDTISGLEAYEDSYDANSIVPASITLLNRIHTIPDRDPKNIFDIVRPDILVGRVVLRMLRSLKEEDEREKVARDILEGLVSYSTKRDFLQLVGYDEGSGHKLVREDFWKDLESQFAQNISGKHSPVPNEEWDLLRVYAVTAEKAGKDFKIPKFTNADEIRSLFLSGSSIAMSERAGVGVEKERHLWWDAIVQVFGSETAIKKALAILRKAEGDTPIVELVQRYLDGWRPKR